MLGSRSSSQAQRLRCLRLPELWPRKHDGGTPGPLGGGGCTVHAALPLFDVQLLVINRGGQLALRWAGRWGGQLTLALRWAGRRPTEPSGHASSQRPLCSLGECVEGVLIMYCTKWNWSY